MRERESSLLLLFDPLSLALSRRERELESGEWAINPALAGDVFTDVTFTCSGQPSDCLTIRHHERFDTTSARRMGTAGRRHADLAACAG